MAKLLSIDRIVRVSVNLQPLAARRRNFGVLLLVGSSDVIDPVERIRQYTGIDGVAQDFGLDAPEYAGAELFFSQTPRPSILQIGRWVRTASPALLRGAIVDGNGATASSWAGITDGAFAVRINGLETSITGLDFSSVTNLNGVASIITTALASHSALCRFDGERFVLATTNTGASSTLGYATAISAEGGAGGGNATDISPLLRWTAATALPPINGSDGESPKECVAHLADVGDWYGCVFTEPLTVEQHLDVAGYIEAAPKSRIYGITDTDSRTLDKAHTEDVASRLKALKRKRSMVAFSRHPHAVISALGRAFTVNFNANRSTITLKFKQMPGVVAEGLTETQAVALETKRCNVFAAYNNDTAIYQEGVMSGDAYFDEIHGTDWLQNAVQNEVWNLLYQSKTKIPQTNAGVNQIVNVIEAVMGEAVNNGLVAPGVWNADGFGQIERGDYLPKGYYIYVMPVELQPQSEREQRKCPPIQCAIKLAGAIHFVDVQIDVNR